MKTSTTTVTLTFIDGTVYTYSEVVHLTCVEQLNTLVIYLKNRNISLRLDAFRQISYTVDFKEKDEVQNAKS